MAKPSGETWCRSSGFRAHPYQIVVTGVYSLLAIFRFTGNSDVTRSDKGRRQVIQNLVFGPILDHDERGPGVSRPEVS
jgi:hypothetical protein